MGRNPATVQATNTSGPTNISTVERLTLSAIQTCPTKLKRTTAAADSTLVASKGSNWGSNCTR